MGAASAPFAIHTRVNVGPAYVGNGQYQHEPICDRSWFVVGTLPAAPWRSLVLA
jgi:hypothetical protein